MSAYRASEAPAPGALIAEFRPRSVGRVVAAIGLLLTGVIVDLAMLASPPQQGNHWVIFLMWGVLFPAVGLLMLVGRKPDHVRVHEHALVVGARVVPWHELVELRTKRHLSGRRALRPVLDRHFFRTRAGETFEARCAMVDLDALLEHLRARTIESMLSDARARLAAGEAVAFGELALTDEAVRSVDVTLPRSSIEMFSFEGPGQRITIKGKGSAWLEAPLEDVPNAHVLLALLR